MSDRAQSKFTILIFQLLEDSATENSYTRVTVYLENVEKLFCVFTMNIRLEEKVERDDDV